MNLQDIGQIGGLIGVAASLIYVAIQISANSKALRAATYQQLSNGFISFQDRLASDGELMDIVLRGDDEFSSLTRVEKARYRVVLVGWARLFENAWFQHRIGVLREQDWESTLGDMRAILSIPGVRTAWPLIKNRSSVAFQEYVDGLIKTLPVSEPGKPIEEQKDYELR